ncbi:MAG: OmpA family protein [Petrimonas sp.]|jgi:outer membrane protein OmpA-like peptidoglycan-associated protein|uniref:OmpA family protein n=1 Tax=Petrimonas sp. TaxID=2023866 RepID=UPI002B364B75|nr:OmpA family protein [Petrimonas sp.]MEA5045901.1 OmpA family protein [Petrimonas sp.]
MKAKIGCFLLSTLLFSVGNVNAQFLERLGKSAERAAERTVERRVEREASKKTDEALDKVFESGKSQKGEKEKDTGSLSVNGHSGFSSQSKFDFVPGDKVIFYDDFSVDALGDFPAKWNTNSNGEIVTLKNQPGKWLKVPDNTISFPEMQSKLPQNFTVEFDLVYPASGQRPPVTFGFTEVANPARASLQHKNIFYFFIPSSVKQHIGYSSSLYSGKETTTEWPVDKMVNQVMHVSIAVNSNRIRMYMDARKIFDLPRGFDQNGYRNNFHFRAAPLIPQPKDGFYISNLRVAESGKDAWSELVKTGKFSTTGIYFESGSVKVKPESHAVIKEIADALNENPTMKIEIIGHTDDTGTATANQTLSEQRAAAVKAYLHQTFGIDDLRLSTSGKGQSQPVADNSTTEGKAQNRRVEFVKI